MSANHKPLCLPGLWPESNSPRLETRQPQCPYSFPLANRPSSSAARRGPPEPTAGRRPAGRSPSPYLPALRQAAHRAPFPAILELAYIRGMAAKEVSARPDWQTQTEQREQGSEAWSQFRQLIHRGSLREVADWRLQDLCGRKAVGQAVGQATPSSSPNGGDMAGTCDEASRPACCRLAGASVWALACFGP